MAVTTANVPNMVRQNGQALPPTDRLPLITKLTLISILIPIQFEVSGQLLTPARIIFLVTVPIFFIQLFTGRFGRLIPSDYLVLAYGFWMAVSVTYHAPHRVVPFVGSNVLIILGGYLTARATIRSPEQFYSFVKLLTVCVLLLIPLGLPELLDPDPTRSRPNMVVPPLIEKIPFVESGVDDVLYPPRAAFGTAFDRAQTVFPHPIHMGMFASGAFALVLIGMTSVWSTFTRFMLSGLILFTCFMTLSSGPLLAAAAQIGLIGYYWITRNIKWRWGILGVSVTVVYSILEVMSTRLAIFVIVSILAFSSHTAYSRRTILINGIAQVKRTPVLGVGFDETWLPFWIRGTLDNQWLLAAVAYGVPCFLFLFLFFLTPMIQAGRRDFTARPDLNAIRLSWIIVIVSLMLCMATVALWGQVYTYYFMLVGAGVWLISYDTGQAPKTAAESGPDAPQPTTRYTRFPHGKPAEAGPAPRPGLARPQRARSRLTSLAGLGLAVALGFALSAAPAMARAYHVAAPENAQPGGDGSAARPFDSVKTAIQAGAGAGDTLLLGAGAYGNLEIKGHGDLGGLEIAPAPGATVQADRIVVHRSGNFRLGGLQVWPRAFPVSHRALVTVDAASPDVHLHDLDIRAGADAGDYLGWSLETWLDRRVDGVRFHGPGGSLTNSRLTATRFGINALGSNIEISGNLVDGFSGDGLRGLGNNDVFTGNVVQNCIKIDENHDDGFQSWGRKNPDFPNDPTKRLPVKNLRIESNVILEWTGPEDHPLRCILQGIGLFDGPYENLVIRNNLVVVSRYHGITVSWVQGGEISHNTVTHTGGAIHPKKPWIGVFASKQNMPSRDVVVANNMAHTFNLKNMGRGGAVITNLPVPRPAVIYRDPAGGDWQIKPGMDAATAADPRFVPAYDIQGRARPQGGGADLGAFETGDAPSQ